MLTTRPERVINETALISSHSNLKDKSSILKPETPLLTTYLPGVPLFRRGKVRDVYDLGDQLLIVATDRISAFDCVMPNGIPDKGRVLTALSLFWFDLMKDLVPNHVMASQIEAYPAQLHPFADQLEGRSMLVKKTEAFPVECVARGYLAGSGWKDYRNSGRICGVQLPEGLLESSLLPKPIFTPATKAESGHDENISEAQMAELVGPGITAQLKNLTLALYQRASEYARQRGILICDTKFEFGQQDGTIIWIDEALTPDSSRFWPADTYQAGRSQNSFDKQFVRDYLETLDWDKQPPAPELPEPVVAATRARYLDAYHRLTGRELRVES